MPPRDLRIDEVTAPAKMTLGDVLTFRVKITNDLAGRRRGILWGAARQKKRVFPCAGRRYNGREFPAGPGTAWE